MSSFIVAKTFDDFSYIDSPGEVDRTFTLELTRGDSPRYKTHKNDAYIAVFEWDGRTFAPSQTRLGISLRG
jgi:hypothetical protein